MVGKGTGQGTSRTAAKRGQETREDPIYSQIELCLKLWGLVRASQHPICLGKQEEDGAE